MKKKLFYTAMFAVFMAVNAFCIETAPADFSDPVPHSAYTHYLNAVLFEKDNKLEEAVTEYEKTLQLDPKAAYVYKNLAALYIKMGRIEDAKKLAEKSVELDKTDPDVYSFLGTVYYLKGDLDKANEMFEQMYVLDKTRKESLLYIANINLKANPRKSLEFLGKYLVEDPQSADVYYQIALIHSELDEPQKAVENFEKAIALEPDYFQAHLALAREYEKQKQPEKAIVHYQKCLELEPDNRLIAEYLGTLYLERSDYKEAEKIFEKIKESSKSDILSNFWLGILAEEKSDFEKAIQYIKSMSGHEQDTGLLLRLSYYYARIKNTKKSVEYLKKAYKIDPQNPEVCFFLGLAYETQNKMDLALRYFNEAVAVKDDFPEAHFQRAVVLDKQKKFRQSVNALLKVIALNPNHASAYNYLGYSFADRNIRLEDAETFVSAALKIEPENGAYIDSLGWVYYRKGEYEKAAAELAKAKEKLKDPVIADHLGDALWMKYRVEKSSAGPAEALAAWEGALAADPGNKKIAAKISRAKTYGFEFPETFRELNKTRLQYRDLLGSMSCLVSISSKQPNLKFSARGLLYYLKAGKLRIDIFGPLMVPAGSVLYDKKIRVYPEELKAEFEALLGGSAESLEDAAEFVANFFSGAVIEKFFAPSVMEKKKGRRITFEDEFIKLRIDSRKRQIEHLSYFSSGGLQILADLKDYAVVEGINVPKKIIITIPELDVSYTIKISNIGVNAPVADGFFDIEKLSPPKAQE